MQNKKSKFIKTLGMSILGIFLIALILYIMPNFLKENYRKFLQLPENSIITNLNNELVQSENYPLYENDELFLPVDFIKDYIDNYIFWDSNENKLTITTENNVIRMETDNLEYFINNEPLKLDFPVYNIENIAYMPSSFLSSFYKLNIDYKPSTNIVNIDMLNIDKIESSILKKGTPVRFTSSRKSPIIEKINQGEKVTVISDTENNYTKIVTENGYIGFVKTKALGERNTILGKTEDENITNETSLEKQEGKINLVFDQMQNVISNRNEMRRTYIDGLDVLVPTWFSFINNDGDIKNIADKSYINWAHKNGYKVWALITDNFDAKTSHAVLSSTKVREHVIKQLLSFVSLYNLDGINIDFESVPNKDGEYFIQFLRELAPPLREQGAVLSVDVFVPKPWTSHYNRNEVGKIADYVIVMGYDEHYSGSESAGSVASISWSKEAIENTLKEGVPKDKLILGIPFYTRIWQEKEENGDISLSSKAYGMENAYKFMTEKGGKFNWLEDMGQYYSEVKENNITYKVWLEDEKSLEERLNLVLKYDIAGVGGWKRGLEKPYIWELIKSKLKG